MLMLISMLLLAGFLGQWLYAQYQDEKQGLEKELTHQLAYAQEEVTDSSILKTLVLPALDKHKSKFNYNIQVINSNDPDAMKRLKTLGKEIDLRSEQNNTALDSIIAERAAQFKNGTQAAVSGKQIKAKIITINGGEQFTTDFSPGGDSAKINMVTKAVEVLIKGIAGGTNNSVGVSISAVKNSFDKRLAKLGYNFRTSLAGKQKSAGTLVINNSETGLDANIWVSGFNSFLLKKLIPETLFALLLLAITGTAFYTMRRNMKSQQRLNVMKNDLVSNMTHELKTPIATVKVALEALDNYQMINDPKTTKDYLHMAVSEMERLELLVNQALNTSLLESGNIQLQFEKCDLSQIAQQVITAMSLKVQQAGATINIDKHGEAFMVNGDKLHLQGVLINLIDNCLKYAGPSPEISITLKERTDSVILDVSDNGPGISPKYLTRVFEKFFRVPTGNIHNTRGYGLGLSYARHVIEQHGGTIDVTNNHTGGCTFSINLKKA